MEQLREQFEARSAQGRLMSGPSPHLQTRDVPPRDAFALEQAGVSVLSRVCISCFYVTKVGWPP